jgi:hypothetical protein
MRLIVCCFFLITFCCNGLYAQQDSLPATHDKNVLQANLRFADSLRTDSVIKANRIQFVADSFAMASLFVDSTFQSKIVNRVGLDNIFYSHSFSFIGNRPKTELTSGEPRKSRERWVLAAIIGLVIYTALLNIFLSKDISSVIQSFYNKNALSQLDKESGLINSWAFVGLFILFSLTCGLVLYQLAEYRNFYFPVSGFQLFIWLSVVVGLLFVLKFLVLKFIGFVFDINALVSEYIAILNLTYFNIAFVFLSVALCFSLLDTRFVTLLKEVTIGLIAVIIAWQYIRNSVNIISNFRFHKFYLFIYLCALEICPILVLIKALDI